MQAVLVMAVLCEQPDDLAVLGLLAVEQDPDPHRPTGAANAHRCLTPMYGPPWPHKSVIANLTQVHLEKTGNS